MRAGRDLLQQQGVELQDPLLRQDIVDAHADVGGRDRPRGLYGDEAGLAAHLAGTQHLVHVLHIDVGDRIGLLGEYRVVLVEAPPELDDLGVEGVLENRVRDGTVAGEPPDEAVVEELAVAQSDLERVAWPHRRIRRNGDVVVAVDKQHQAGAPRSDGKVIGELLLHRDEAAHGAVEDIDVLAPQPVAQQPFESDMPGVGCFVGREALGHRAAQDMDQRGVGFRTGDAVDVGGPVARMPVRVEEVG